MKTVQKCLIEIDEESLADHYFAEYPIDFVMLHDQNHTVAEIRRVVREQFIDYMRKMREIPIRPCDEEGKTAVFYASKGHRNHERRIIVEMRFMEEVLTSDEPEHYACGLTSQAEVMGYFVADTPLTQKNIESVLADILYEMSFFEYDQEGLLDVIESLKRSEEDIKQGCTYSMEECGSIWVSRRRSVTKKPWRWNTMLSRPSMPMIYSAAAAKRQSCESFLAHKHPEVVADFSAHI